MKTTQGAHIFSFSPAVFGKSFSVYHQSGVTELQGWMSEDSGSITDSGLSFM